MEFIGIIFVALSVVIVNGQSDASVEVQKHYEFENALPAPVNGIQIGKWQWRSEASMDKTLRLEDRLGKNQMINLTLCIKPYDVSKNVTFHVDDIRYSNDGEADTVTLRFNGYTIAEFQTAANSQGGYEWNVFRNSGRLGPELQAMEGEYILSVSAKTDQYGVELDRIRINAENHHPEHPLYCGATYTEK